MDREQQDDERRADALQYGFDIQSFIGDALRVMQEKNADRRQNPVQDKASRDSVSRHL